MNEKEYFKPQMVDLSADEMMDVSGGGAVAVVIGVGLAIAALMAISAYTVVNTGLVVNIGGGVNIYELLKLFEVYDIIELEKESTSVEGIKYIFNGDLHYRDVRDFILDELKSDGGIRLCNEKGRATYYSAVQMRMRVMQSQEYQLFVQKDNDILAYVSMIGQPLGFSKTLVLKEFIFSKKLSQEEVINYFKGIISKITDTFKTKAAISRLRVMFYDTNITNDVVNILEKIGFKLTVRLKDETVAGDLHFYDYKL